MAQLDCQDIISRRDFIDHFRERVQNGQHFELHDTLKRREAICRRSEVFKHRRRTDLLQQPYPLPSSHPQLGCMR